MRVKITRLVGFPCRVFQPSNKLGKSFMDNLFYTYAFLREDRTPYYVGKGKGNRAYRKRLKGVKRPQDEKRILILKKGLTEQEAFRHEKYMIAVFGRKDLGTGILLNRSEGGEGNSGYRHTEKTKIRLRETSTGRKFKPRTKLHRKRLSAALRGKRSWLGLKHREESKEKISQTRKEKELAKGENNGMFGRNHTEESKVKMSETKKERKVGVGRVWYHNPEENQEKHFAPNETPSPPWVRGRIKGKRLNLKELAK